MIPATDSSFAVILPSPPSLYSFFFFSFIIVAAVYRQDISEGQLEYTRCHSTGPAPPEEERDSMGKGGESATWQHNPLPGERCPADSLPTYCNRTGILL